MNKANLSEPMKILLMKGANDELYGVEGELSVLVALKAANLVYKTVNDNWYLTSKGIDLGSQLLSELEEGMNNTASIFHQNFTQIMSNYFEELSAEQLEEEEAFQLLQRLGIKEPTINQLVEVARYRRSLTG